MSLADVEARDPFGCEANVTSVVIRDTLNGGAENLVGTSRRVVRDLPSHWIEARRGGESSPPRSQRQAPPGFPFFNRGIGGLERKGIANPQATHVARELTPRLFQPSTLNRKEQHSDCRTPLPHSRAEPIIRFKKRGPAAQLERLDDCGTVASGERHERQGRRSGRPTFQCNAL